MDASKAEIGPFKDQHDGDIGSCEDRVDVWMGDEKSGFDILRRWISRAMRPFPLSDTSTGTRIVQA